MRTQEIARRLRERMDGQGWTQVAVSKATSVHQSQISRFRAGKFAELEDNLRRVCEYVGVSLDETVTDPREEDADLRALFEQLIAGLDPSKRRGLSTLLQSVLQLAKAERSARP